MKMIWKEEIKAFPTHRSESKKNLIYAFQTCLNVPNPGYLCAITSILHDMFKYAARVNNTRAFTLSSRIRHLITP